MSADRKRPLDDAEAKVKSSADNNSNAQQVAEHYNTRRELGVEGRLHTKITGLRLFNNWVKSILIGMHTFRGCKVLDLGCGKGGDLRKWSYANIGEYVGMDIAQVSVTQAQKRYSEMHNARFPARFYAQDCYGTERKARQMMRNVSEHLTDGGTFICTIPSANWLMKKLRATDTADLSFGNTVYRVEFAQREPVSVYGFAYAFTLDEAVEDCTEYLVHMPSFVALAEERGLELLYCTGFHELFSQNIGERQNLELFQRMRVVDDSRPSISSDEWEAVGIYLAVAFRKKR
ncbi:mRNA cap guanine-N7 methyltransferase [Coemansia sp. RSA 1694]|nr:mRNA cap guanine-N7 methyltransferase [Coemansia sp. RSA 1694]